MKILKNVQYFALFAMIGALGFSSCQKEEVSIEKVKKVEVDPLNKLKNSSELLEVGDRTEGGVLGYLNPYNTSPNGLVIANDYQRATCWYPNELDDLAIKRLCTTLGCGYDATEAIVEAGGSLFGTNTYAAKICEEYKNDGFEDWFLPNLDEMLEIRINSHLLDGIKDDIYWTSSFPGDFISIDGPVTLARAISFFDEDGYNNFNDYLHKVHRVLPVRLLNNKYRFPPEFSNVSISNITKTSATFQGQVEASEENGNYSIIERGYCLRNAPSPTTQTYIGEGAGSIKRSMPIELGQYYYVRPYAKAYNDNKIYYGDQVEFTALFVNASDAIPSWKGRYILGGSIINNIEAEISEVGICYGKTISPTISDTKVVMTLNGDSFSKTVLLPSYYVYIRAYVKLSDGTVVYGPHNVTKDNAM